MDKLEEAAREFIKKDPILKYGVLEDDVPKLMVDFHKSQSTQQNTLTLDSKIKELESNANRWKALYQDEINLSSKALKQIEQLTKERDALKFKETKALQKYNKCSEDYWDKEKQLQHEKQKVKEMREGLMIVLNKWHLGEADRIIRGLIANNF